MKSRLFSSAYCVALIMGITLIAGCTPRVVVRPNPGPKTPGIRYYRPKPYLLITPAGASTTVEEEEKKKKTTTAGVSDKYVQIQLQWLPDFSEEYAINIRTGLGTNETQLTLENGWNLTSLNTKLDSQTDDNIKAVAELIKGVGSVAAARMPEGKDAVEGTTVIRATNVPIGYYESVIGRDECGKKQFHGWRYVGFAPFNGCPLRMCGADIHYCREIELYGLVFDNGVMTFKQLYRIEAIEQKYNYPIKDDLKTRQSPPLEELKLLPTPTEPHVELLPPQERGEGFSP